MVKITEQDIPPELLDTYNNMVSPQDASAPTQTTVRTRRKVRRGKPPKKDQQDLEPYRAAARFVVLRALGNGGEFDEVEEIRKETSRLARGIVNELYWMEAEVLASKSLTSNPTGAPRVQAASYLYPDPFNQPTTPTHTPGSETEGNPFYMGMTVDGYYYDNDVTWRVVRHDPQQDLITDGRIPVLHLMSGLINIAASDRSGRALRSLVYSPKITAQGSDLYADNAYPFEGAPDTWPTRKTPPTPPPYYNYQQQITHLRNINYSDHFVEDGAREVITRTAPLPMDGYRYNNNTLIQTEWMGTEKIFVPWFAANIDIFALLQSTPFGPYEGKLRGIPWKSWGTKTTTSPEPNHTIFEMIGYFEIAVAGGVLSQIVHDIDGNAGVERISAHYPVQQSTGATTPEKQYWDITSHEWEVSRTVPGEFPSTTQFKISVERVYVTGETEIISETIETREPALQIAYAYQAGRILPS